MTQDLDWTVAGRDWPNRESSRFVVADGLRWHVQVMGEGPALLLLHGTGAATHSWRDVAPLLARTHTVVAPDLPGHGFTATPPRPTDFALPAVARGVAALLHELGVTPHAIVGHSAGVAIGVRMTLDGLSLPFGIVGLNAALLPFPGPLGPLAPLLARTLFYNPFSLSMFAHRASRPGAIADLMRSTGSTLDAQGVTFYERVFRSKRHLDATVALMAHWDLSTLKRDLPNVKAPLALIVGDKDRAVPPDSVYEVQHLIKHARVAVAPGLGHLAHEEDPERIGALILSALQQSA